MMIKRRLRRVKDVWKVRQLKSGWAHLFQHYYGKELVSLDIETTSLDVSKAQILSIGAVVIKGNRVLSSEKLSLTLSPPKDLPKDSKNLTELKANIWQWAENILNNSAEDLNDP